jgi:FecR-like protein
MSKTISFGLLCRLSVASAVLIGLATLAGVAHADKVGVAAAVNPDAFSSLSGAPQSQLNIGKSIFYNERINTTGSGLVQVLLVDGSTFTVGPGSDLVIDKFVYNPKKGTGEITASFTKGVMRFVGGKISKNEDAASIKTPAGVLAIRGCIVMGKITSPTNYGFLLVYGDYLKMKGLTVFQPGNGFFATNGQLVMGPPPKNFTNDVMAGITNGNPATGNSGQPGGNPPTNALNVQADLNNIDEFISDATAAADPEPDRSRDRQANQHADRDTRRNSG